MQTSRYSIIESRGRGHRGFHPRFAVRVLQKSQVAPEHTQHVQSRGTVPQIVRVEPTITGDAFQKAIDLRNDRMGVALPHVECYPAEPLPHLNCYRRAAV